VFRVAEQLRADCVAELFNASARYARDLLKRQAMLRGFRAHSLDPRSILAYVNPACHDNHRLLPELWAELPKLLEDDVEVVTRLASAEI